MNTLPRMYVHENQANDYEFMYAKKDKIRERLISRLHYHESLGGGGEDRIRAYAIKKNTTWFEVLFKVFEISNSFERKHMLFSGKPKWESCGRFIPFRSLISDPVLMDPLLKIMTEEANSFI